MLFPGVVCPAFVQLLEGYVVVQIEQQQQQQQQHFCCHAIGEHAREFFGHASEFRKFDTHH